MDIRHLLGRCTQRQASDMHLVAGMPPLLRIDGDICRLDAEPVAPARVQALLKGLMTESQWQQFCAGFECDFAVELPDLGRFRVNAFTQRSGAAAVFRCIPAQVPSLEQLGLDERFRAIAASAAGLVCITGPTGSGKSTTLAALIDYLNTQSCQHILTIEDPVEFLHASKRSLVNQREVHRDTRSFDAALRAALREDPDTILVGELRDLETIRLALTAAETGHLVFATLHSSSAAKTVSRIVDVFPAAEKTLVRALLAESLQAVIAQTLLKRVGGGRVAAHELMLATPAVRNLIREDKVAQLYSTIQTGAQYGMQTLDQHLQRLVASGQVEPETARATAKTPGVFQHHE